MTIKVISTLETFHSISSDTLILRKTQLQTHSTSTKEAFSMDRRGRIACIKEYPRPYSHPKHLWDLHIRLVMSLMIARSRAAIGAKTGKVVFCKTSVYYTWETHAVEKIALLLSFLCFIRIFWKSLYSLSKHTFKESFHYKEIGVQGTSIYYILTWLMAYNLCVCRSHRNTQ